MTREKSLQVGDRLEISFSEHGEAYRTTVTTNGEIALPFDFNVHAAGRTTSELQEEIRRLYVPKYYMHMVVQVRLVKTGSEIRNEPQ